MTDAVRRLGKYEIIGEIGKGGFATVYRARDLDLGREVALKVLDALLTRDPVWVARFRREARAAAVLDHPRIVTVHEIGQAEGTLFIAMKLLEGGNLAQRLASGGSLPWDTAVQVVSQVAEALDFAHGQGVLHRDLKPANVMLHPRSGAVLTDFGFARLLADNSHSVSLSGGIVGTPATMAPEVWEGKDAGSATDVYALGCILYELVTGQPLFSGPTPPAVMHAHFKPLVLPEAWPEGAPSGLGKVLQTALARDPAARYGRAGDLAAAVAALSVDRLAEPYAAPQAVRTLAENPRERWTTAEEMSQALQSGPQEAAQLRIEAEAQQRAPAEVEQRNKKAETAQQEAEEKERQQTQQRALAEAEQRRKEAEATQREAEAKERQEAQQRALAEAELRRKEAEIALQAAEERARQEAQQRAQIESALHQLQKEVARKEVERVARQGVDPQPSKEAPREVETPGLLQAAIDDLSREMGKELEILTAMVNLGSISTPQKEEIAGRWARFLVVIDELTDRLGSPEAAHISQQQKQDTLRTLSTMRPLIDKILDISSTEPAKHKETAVRQRVEQGQMDESLRMTAAKVESYVEQQPRSKVQGGDKTQGISQEISDLVSSLAQYLEQLPISDNGSLSQQQKDEIARKLSYYSVAIDDLLGRLAPTGAADIDQQVKQGIVAKMIEARRFVDQVIGDYSMEPAKLRAETARLYRQETEQVAFRKLQAKAARQEVEGVARLLSDQQPRQEAGEDVKTTREIEKYKQELRKLFDGVLEELKLAIDTPSLSQQRNEEIARKLSHALAILRSPLLDGTSLTAEQRRVLVLVMVNVSSAVNTAINLLSAEPAKLKAEAVQHAQKEERQGGIRESDKSILNQSHDQSVRSIFSSGSSSVQNKPETQEWRRARPERESQPSDNRENSMRDLISPPRHVVKQSEQQTKQAASLEFQSEAARQEAERKTGIELVRIPAGEFLYGEEKRKVHLSEYWIAKAPVTNAQYAAFIQATGYRAPDHWQNGRIPSGKENHPVVYINWDDAQKFCQWAGLRLPTEQEWEKAARGTDGHEYPWGNQKPDVQRCNSYRAMNGTTPVDKFPLGASPYGLLDMAGNVWEWCEDWYDTQRTMRVLRGGSWNDPTTFVRTVFRFRGVPGIRLDNRGIRCAR